MSTLPPRSFLLPPLPALLSLVSLLACAAPPSADGVTEAIAGGFPEDGEPAVVGVKVVGGAASCTGTFIAPDLVLTAKHCVQLQGQSSPYPVSIMSVGVGNRLRTTTDYRVRKIWTRPGRYTSVIGGLIGRDVAVVAIRPDSSGNLPDVEPIPVFRGEPATLVGREMTFVGFGLRPEGASGDKYKTTGVVERVGGGVLYSAMNICSGDSGGPMIWEDAPGGRAVVGVASFGEEDACPSRQDGHNVILLDIVDTALRAEGYCPAEEDEVCNSVDDDCDGATDEGCAALGEACAEDTDCAFAQLPEGFEPLAEAVTCGDTPAGRVCTRPCDWTRPRTSCATTTLPFSDDAVANEGVYCQRASGCDGWCVAGDPGAGAEGAACAVDADCGSLACVDPGDGSPRCLAPCRGDAGTCADGLVCAAGVDACSACVDPGLVSGRRGLGEPCSDAAECVSERCVEDGERSYCSTTCRVQPDCPEGYHCRDDFCARGPLGQAGEPCASDSDCAPPGTCEAGACVQGCMDADGCPAGFACEGSRCVATATIFGEGCAADAECVTGLCAAAVEGDPLCTRACGAEGGCPAGYACVTGSEPGSLVCAPPVGGGGGGGGCAAAPGAPARGPAALLLVGLVALALRRRRR